jgi:hypothetical protein
MATTETLCTDCEDVLDAEDPYQYVDVDGQPVCEECHDDREFECCRCLNYDYDEYQHDIGCLLILANDDENLLRFQCGDPVQSGVYRIIKHPYYGGPLIGKGYLFGRSIERLGDSPADCDPDPYPCGHLCRECKSKTLAELGIEEGGDGDGD